MDVIKDIINAARENWDAIIAAVGVVGIACEATLLALAALVRALRGVASALFALATYTPTERDDDLLNRLILALELAAAWLDRAAAWVPRLRAGAGRSARGGQPPGVTLLLPLLVVLGASTLSACGASSEARTRTALDAAARAVVSADVLGAEEFIARSAACYDEPTLEAWYECMRPAFRLEEALRGARAALYAAEATVDALGSDGWLQAAPCVAKALGDLSDALEAFGVPLPRDLANLLEVAQSVGGLCDGGAS